MAIELPAFHTDFFQEVHGAAGADGEFVEDAFFDRFGEYLVDAGEIDTIDRAHYVSPRGLRIDGYAGDPADSDGVLSVLVCEFDQSGELNTLTGSQMAKVFARLNRFVDRARDPGFRNQLEETSPAFGIADLIATRWPAVVKVRLLLLTNRQLSSRVDRVDEGLIDGVPISHSVWDIGRLHRYVVAGHGRDELQIDFTEDEAGPIPVLSAHLQDVEYVAYLAVVPGAQLARVYDRWGARLLEQNVRCFLQARSKVNKGLRNTLQNEPEMFFAYNNGITATAEEVDTRQTDQGLVITRLKNFQIVNGGQTTASIHAASRDPSRDLSKVFVQMKLSVVPPEQATEVVPKISEYANSQNRVNAADFFANHPFHVRMEEFSRQVYAPAPEGSFKQTKWFYERARGQYQDARGYMTAAERKRFDLEYPRKQMFTKTDLAKFLNLWEGLPDTVSKGAQKNFAHFAAEVGKRWEADEAQFNEAFFKHAISKAIVFRHVERLVTAQPWYQGGYRANVVAYAIAKLAHDVGRRDWALDFGRIWEEQSISDALDAALIIVSGAVHEVITSPVGGIQNVTEWAKKTACWDRVRSLPVSWPVALRDCVIGAEEHRFKEHEARQDQTLKKGLKAKVAVVKAGDAFWKDVLAWADENKVLSPKQRGVLEVVANGGIPSVKQSEVVLKTLVRLQEEGCSLTLPP